MMEFGRDGSARATHSDPGKSSLFAVDSYSIDIVGGEHSPDARLLQ